MKKFVLYIVACIVATSSLFVLLTGHAHAATATWDGGGADNNLNTAANWVGDTTPTAGDDLIFPAGAARKTLTNNFTAGTSFNSITFSGATTNGETDYTISGNSMALVDGVVADFSGFGGSPMLSLPLSLSAQSNETSLNNTLTLTGAIDIGSNTVIFDGSGNYIISGVITGSGTIIKSGPGLTTLSGANTSYSGAITVSTGTLVAADKDALGTNAGATTVNNGGQLSIFLPQAQKVSTIAEPITIHIGTYDDGSGGDLQGVLSVTAACGLSYCSNSDITLSGTLTTTVDMKVDSEATTRLTGTISGAHTIGLSDGQYGTLVINSASNGSSTANGSYEAPIVTHTYSTSSPSTNINVYKNVTAVVTGTVGNTFVAQFGKLKGNGTVGNLSLSEGTIAPGMSPGILNTGNVTMSAGTLEEELGGTASGQYDQLNVTGSVDLGTTTDLSLSFYNNYLPAVGSSFTIINNDGSDAVVGHFAGKTEGSTFSYGGRLFKITYAGGDGNDVVLTVSPTPTTPDTGFQKMHSNPLLAVVLLCVVTPLLVLMARRSADSEVR